MYEETRLKRAYVVNKAKVYDYKVIRSATGGHKGCYTFIHNKTHKSHRVYGLSSAVSFVDGIEFANENK